MKSETVTRLKSTRSLRFEREFNVNNESKVREQRERLIKGNLPDGTETL